MSWRSNLYAGSANASYYRGKAMGRLPQYPGDGQTACLTNCACYLTFAEGDYPWIVEVTWHLTPAEHCDDCIALAATWNPYVLELPIGLSASEFVRWMALEKDGFPLDLRAAIALRT